ncbi:MAG: TonB family protein [Deltaproteobacteria bacterium]|nr:TonB family protein [Deltaproteobacteria bacterium]
MAIARQRTVKIGLVQDGKLISESVLQDKEDVTIGTDPSNTITVSEASLPKKHKLIARTKNGFDLNYVPGMEGRISIAQGTYDLNRLDQSGFARGKDAYSSIDLGREGKGKLSIGKTTILFQVVPVPPPPPIEKLPREFHGGYLQRMDPVFVVIMVLSTILHIGAIRYLNSIEVEERLSEDKVAEFVSTVTTEDIIIPPEEEPEVPDDATLEEQKKETDTMKAKEAGDGGNEEEAEAPPEDVTQKGLLAVITSASGSGSVADIIGDSGTDSGIDNVMSKISGGINIAKGSNVGGSRGGDGSLTGTDVSASSLGNVAGGKPVGTGDKTEKKVAAKLTTTGNMSGNIDSTSARTYIMQRIGGVRACYERQLKIDPTLSGKIAVTFTIGADGGVTGCSVASSTIGNAEVPACVCRGIQRWRFPTPPDGGSASVNYSFIFTPAN